MIRATHTIYCQKVGHSKWQINDHWLMQLGAMHNIYNSYFGQSTRMVDSGIFTDKICWFYPNRESTFWTMHAILKLQVPILAMRNNKMGHRINKMWTLINKVGHRNVKLVVTYQQVGFKKQQNGSRVLYRWMGRGNTPALGILNTHLTG